MGEYYNWINVDKKEYICPGDFDYGNKFHESMHKDSIPLHALHILFFFKIIQKMTFQIRYQS